MNNKVIEQNKINQPIYYHRQYVNDFKVVSSEKIAKNEKIDQSVVQQIQRIAIIVLPFISLYQPFGSVISYTMNTVRGISCLSQTGQAISVGDTKELGSSLLQSALAVAAIAGTIFGYIYAMLITSMHDVIINLYELVIHLNYGEYEKLFESFLQFINNALYLAMFILGSFELIIFSYLAQILIEIYKSHESFQKYNGKDSIDILEGILHLAMAGIRGYQVKPMIDLLEFKWNLEKADTQKLETNIQKNDYVVSSDLVINDPKGKALYTAKSELIDILKKYEGKGKDGSYYPAIINAIHANDFYAIQILLNSNIYLINGIEMQRALYEAVCGNNRKIITMILDKGNSPNLGNVIFAAFFRDNVDIMKLLLERGADPNARGEYNYMSGTLLYFALNFRPKRRGNNRLILDLLIKFGGIYQGSGYIE